MQQTIDELNQILPLALKCFDEDTRVFTDILASIDATGCKKILLLEKSLVLEIEDGFWYLVANTSDGVEEACQAIKSHTPTGTPVMVCAKQTIGLSIIEETFGIKRGSVCIAHGLFPPKVQPLTLPDNFEFKNLTLNEMDMVLEHYHLISDPSYIKWRIESGEMWGAWVNGEPVGFIGLHGEHTMGMLEIFPQFRRHGYARLLETCLSNLLVEKGKIPFCHIFVDNDASLLLHEKMNYTKFDRQLCWLE